PNHPAFALARKAAELRLLILLLQRRQNTEPSLRRAEPELVTWDQLITLANAADPQGHDFRACADRRRIDRRSAVGTERLFPLVAALGSLHIDLRCARQEPEGPCHGWYNGAKGRT